IYMGESGENTNAWIAEFRALLDAQNVGWTFWPYKRMRKLVDDRVNGALDSALVGIQLPEGFGELERYAEAPRANYEDVRKARPKDPTKIKEALAAFVKNLDHDRCTENAGYRKALGF